MTERPPDSPRHHALLATCAFGLESVLVRELRDLGYDAKSIGTGRVLFSGDDHAICRANIHLRTADRVLIRVGTFPVGSGDPGFENLFEGVKGLPWENWIARTARFPVSGRCVRSHLSSEPAVQRATKRAIADRLGAAHGANLPETGPTVAIEVAIVENVATLTLDTSGAGLHKRGYRKGAPGEAALKETMAAGLALLSVWRRGRPLIDPFCGSGTIAIESAMIARGIAPGLKRAFASEHWIDPGSADRPLIDQRLWQATRDAAAAAIDNQPLTRRILASDLSAEQVALARSNARTAGVENDIDFGVRDFSATASDLEFGSIITNPPYGVRLGESDDIERLYRSMPLVFRRMPTWSFHVFTGRLDLERLFNLEAARRRKLYNSKIECCLFTFLGPRPPKVDAGRAGPPDSRPVFGGLRERDRKEAEEFGKCLSRNLRHLRRYPERGIPAYRVYERDVPDVPLIIDRFGAHFHAVETERVHSRSAAQHADWFALMRQTISEATSVPIESVHVHEAARHRGLIDRAGARGEPLVIEEGDPPARYLADLDQPDPGLRTDLRLFRQIIRERSPGKHVLSAFCGAGSLCVTAAVAGAERTVGVEREASLLEFARRNHDLNRLGGANRGLVHSDVFDFLRGAPTAAFDLAILELPFTPSKRATRDERAERNRALVDLLDLLRSTLKPGASVYLVSVDPRVELLSPLESAWSIRDISRQTVPPECRNRDVHRCWAATARARATA